MPLRDLSTAGEMSERVRFRAALAAVAVAVGILLVPPARADEAGGLRKLRAENQALRKQIDELRGQVQRLEQRLADLSATVRQLQGRAAARGDARRPALAEPSRKLSIRVVPGGWGEAETGDIQKVLLSAAGELWKHFPRRKLAPIVVKHGSDGPIVLFRKNAAGEYLVRLDIEGRYWCQFAYQFAHEFCHILTNYSKRDGRENLWFEESLCEMASMYAVTAMSETWRTSPPYPNWRGYARSLADYAKKLSRKKGPTLAPGQTLADWLRANLPELRRDPHLRGKNRLVAMQLLPLFEAEPQRWEAVGYLNQRPTQPKGSLESYLANWLREVPQRHKPFVGRVIKLLGVKTGR
jgi:hypothetical protein